MHLSELNAFSQTLSLRFHSRALLHQTFTVCDCEYPPRIQGNFYPRTYQILILCTRLSGFIIYMILEPSRQSRHLNWANTCVTNCVFSWTSFFTSKCTFAIKFASKTLHLNMRNKTRPVEPRHVFLITSAHPSSQFIAEFKIGIRAKHVSACKWKRKMKESERDPRWRNSAREFPRGINCAEH